MRKKFFIAVLIEITSNCAGKGIRGQLALFNSTMKMWIKRKFVSLYIAVMRCVILTFDVYLCDY
jgi:hypothetical protein